MDNTEEKKKSQVGKAPKSKPYKMTMQETYVEPIGAGEKTNKK